MTECHNHGVSGAAQSLQLERESVLDVADTDLEAVTQTADRCGHAGARHPMQWARTGSQEAPDAASELNGAPRRGSLGGA